MDTVVIAAAAFGGALITATLGWLQGHEPFNVRKYSASLLAGLVAAVLFAALYETDRVTGQDIMWAILGGAGADVASNRVIGFIESLGR